MNIDITFDIIISALLFIVAVYSIILGRRISRFNSTKVELVKFLDDFNSSISRAEKNINELKEMGSAVDENLKSQIKKARFIANDLSFLSEKGEGVANSLESKISMSREMYRKIVSESSNATKAPIKQGQSPSAKSGAAIGGSNATNTNNINNTTQAAKPKPVSSQPSEQPNKSQMSPGKKQALNALLKEIEKKRNQIK